MLNVFYQNAIICKDADLIPEAYMYEQIGKCFDEIGKEGTIKAIEAHIDQCFEHEYYLRSFMITALHLI